MVNFETKTEGEKFAFADSFIKKLKLVKVLRPSLNEADAIKIVAVKYYDRDLKGVFDCIDFIEEKCGEGVDLFDAPLNAKRLEYITSLENKQKEKESAHQKLEKDKTKKEQEKNSAEAERNKAKDDYDKAFKKYKNSGRMHRLLIIGAVAAVLFAIVGFGGIAGLFNFGTGVLFANFTTMELLSVSVLAWLSYKVYEIFKGKKPKEKKRKTGFEKKKEKAGEKEAEYKKAQEKVNEKSADFVKLNTEAEAAKKEADKAKQFCETEKQKMDSCQTTDISIEDAVCLEIKGKWQEALQIMERNGSTAKEKNNLTDWYNHYVGAIFYGTAKGIIKSEADIKQIQNEAYARFEQIIDPLDISNKTYSKQTVNMGHNSKTNQTLEDMYNCL